MNTALLPSKFESEITEDDALYRRAFRFLMVIRRCPEKLRQACNALSEISSSDTYIEGDEDEGDD
jgi:hypothetical protein